jgi:hypothetical protein
MQTIVRLFAGFVTRILARMGSHTVVTVDTTEADQAWWEEQLKEIQEQHYEELGNWWMEEVPGKCLSCPQPLRLMRWQQSGYGDQCDRCISVEEKRYKADDAELEDAMSVKISF